MYTRRKWWLLALLVSACALNPHPDIPSASDSPGAMSGAAGSSTSGNSSGGSSGSGSPVVLDPGTGARGPDVGEGGDRGSSAGDSGLPEGGAAEGGASEGGASEGGASEGGASESGAAGADQLAPGPTK